MYVAFYYICSTWNKRPTNYTVSPPFKFVGETSSIFLSLSLKVQQFSNWNYMELQLTLRYALKIYPCSSPEKLEEDRESRQIKRILSVE